MRKIFYSLLMVGMALCFAACDEDRDSNPIFQEAPTFVLNTPGYAANNVYDLKNSDYVVLTATQPDYGYPAPVVYTVFVSLDNANFTPLATTYTTAKMQIPASELNEMILSLAGAMDLSAPIPVYMKVQGRVPSIDYNAVDAEGNPVHKVSESNVITLPSVMAFVPEVTIELPTKMHIVGDFPASSGWSTFVPLHAAYSQDGMFYGVVYLQDNAEFKVNPDAAWAGNDKGYGQVTAVDKANAGFQSAGDGETSNMKVTTGGWYTVIVKTKVANGAVNYTVEINEAKVYVIGAAEGGNWSTMAEWRFTAPADATGEWQSPAFVGAGELRLFVDCGIDWWKTEFTIKSDGTLYYRDVDIPKNWADNVGADFSYQVSAGQKAYLNFTTETGRVE